MKRFKSCGGIVALCLLTLGVFSACQTDSTATSGSTTTAAPSGDGARLVVHRAPNLGEMVILSIDGAKVSEIRVGDTYNGTLTPGKHVVSVLLEPNQLHLAPTQQAVTAAKGQVYEYTVMWQGDTVVLK